MHVREIGKSVFVDGVMYEKVVKEGNPGDLIYIVNPWRNEGYEKGDVLTVASRFGRGCFVKESDTLISFKEYVVLEPAEITSKKLSVNVTVDTTKIIERIETLVDELEDIKNELSLKEFEEQVDNVVVPTQRQHIIDKAKADVKQLLNQNYPPEYYANLRPVWGVLFTNKEGHVVTDEASFIINKEKRVVVCLIKKIVIDEVKLKGIAKCAPNDCFNVHIGKAIALRRALGLDVPEAYLNVPQPERAEVGDVVSINDFNCTRKLAERARSLDYLNYGRAFITGKNGKWLGEDQFKIIDDSRE